VLLAIDVLVAKVAGRLEAAGLSCILLKGPALADWLYPVASGPMRTATRVDPSRRSNAEAVPRDFSFGHMTLRPWRPAWSHDARVAGSAQYNQSVA
jgi:hypothetical protein